MKITYTPHMHAEWRTFISKWTNYGEFPENAGEIGALLDKIEQLQEQTKWISVKESLPEEQKKVLVYGNGEWMINSIQDGRWYLYMETVTHWKPLDTPVDAQ
jgi:hypothetical protein